MKFKKVKTFATQKRCSRILLGQNARAQNQSPRRFIQKTPPIEPDPDECCGSGCNNCVWLMYTDDLIEHFGKEVRTRIAFFYDPLIWTDHFIFRIDFYLFFFRGSRKQWKSLKPRWQIQWFSNSCSWNCEWRKSSENTFLEEILQILFIYSAVFTLFSPFSFVENGWRKSNIEKCRIRDHKDQADRGTRRDCLFLLRQIWEAKWTSWASFRTLFRARNLQSVAKIYLFHHCRATAAATCSLHFYQTAVISVFIASSHLTKKLDSKSNNSKSSRRKKLPLPSNGGNESSLLGDFLEPSSSASNKSGKRLAPSFGREKSLLSSGSHTVEGESGAQDLLERLTNLSSRSNESGSKRSVNSK